MVYLEYIFLDGNKTQGLRSKTKIIGKNPNKFNFKEVKDALLSGESNALVPNWNFDGSSTGQATTDKSELILKPVNIFKDPFLKNKEGDDYLVMCEVFNTDGTPHTSNKRHDLREAMVNDQECWMGLEQEYFIYDAKTNWPLGWPTGGFPKPQADFYCGVGAENIRGREFAEQHAILCSDAGIEITGINMEVAMAQQEYQLFSKSVLEGSDEFWISRYIMYRLSETYGYKINIEPKPFKGNEINGSGCHVNFSTKQMREDIRNKKSLVIEACHLLGQRIEQHISVYGHGNEDRLTGANETCSIKDFKFAVGDRTASIRIPSSINDNKSPGYLEDRRPASNINPYEVMTVMIETICEKVSVQDKVIQLV